MSKFTEKTVAPKKAAPKKAAPKKAAPKTVNVSDFIEEIKEVKITKKVNWTKVPNGTYFTLVKEGKHKITGQIQKEGTRIFFLQDHISMDGSTPVRPLYGYKNGWVIDSKNPNVLITDKISDLQFYIEAPAGFTGPKPRLIVGNGIHKVVVVNKGLIHVGCQKITREQIVKVLNAMDDFTPKAAPKKAPDKK